MTILEKGIQKTFEDRTANVIHSRIDNMLCNLKSIYNKDDDVIVAFHTIVIN